MRGFALPLFLSLSLCLLFSGVLAADENYGMSKACTETTQAGPLNVKLCDLYFEKKPKAMFLMWDATSYLDALTAPGALTRSAMALLQGRGRAAYPHAKRFQLAAVRVTERDNYGLPRWDTIKILLRLDCGVDKRGHVVAVP